MNIENVDNRLSVASLDATLECISTALQRYIDGEITADGVSKLLSDYVAALHFEAVPNVKVFSVAIVENTKEPFFGARVFPEYSEATTFLSENANPSLTTKRGITRWDDAWIKMEKWQLEIDSRCFTDPKLRFTPDEIIAFILYEVINVVYTTEVPKMFLDAYRDNYFMNNLYSRRGIEILYRLYWFPLISACTNKHWLLEDEGIDICRVSESDAELKELRKYNQHIRDAVFKVIKNYGNTLIQTDAEKYNKLAAEITLMNKYANDYIKRKNELKDMIIVKASHTSSKYLKMACAKILKCFGFDAYERYTGALIESITVDMLADPLLLQKCDIRQSMNNKFGRTTDALFESIGAHVQRMHKGFGAPKLPCDRDIDMTFVDIDRMENQSDRSYVLDRIYRLINMITIFEDYYADNDVVMREMRPTIDRQRKLLDDARERVLAARSFSTKKYKVFVKVPVGYEG